MRWRGRRQSQNIEDRRRRSGAGFPGGLPRSRGRGVRRASGGGIGFLIILGILWLVFGINPVTLLQQGGTGVPTIETGQPTGGGIQSTQSELDDFIATVYLPRNIFMPSCAVDRHGNANKKSAAKAAVVALISE